MQFDSEHPIQKNKIFLMITWFYIHNLLCVDFLLKSCHKEFHCSYRGRINFMIYCISSSDNNVFAIDSCFPDTGGFANIEVLSEVR